MEDLDSAIGVSVFPTVYDRVAMSLVPDSIVKVSGKINVREDNVEFHAENLVCLDVSADDKHPVRIVLAARRCTPGLVDELKSLLMDHHGGNEVLIRLTSNSGQTTLRLGDRFRVNPSQSMMADLKALLGPNCLDKGGDAS